MNQEKTMKAARLHKIGDFRVDTVSIPDISGEELLVKIGGCGICGSDIPRIYELGTSLQTYPLILGHEFSGEIVGIGAKAEPSLIGTRGTFFPCIPCRKCSSCETGNFSMCLDYDYLGSRSDGGFAEFCRIPSSWHFVASENPEMSMEALAMVEPATVAQHALRQGNVKAGDSVMILGAGPIGIMVARWARIFGAQLVLLVDIVDKKVKFAAERGLNVINSSKQNTLEEVIRLTKGRMMDVVIEGTGSASGLNSSIDCARMFGTVVMLGNPTKDTTIAYKRHSSILRKELNIKGVWNSFYASMPRNEWKYTVEVLDDGILEVEDLITHRSDIDGLPELCEDINKHKITICKAMYSTEK